MSEQIIRDYLMSLINPKALIDQETVTTLSDKLKTSNDPVERLALRAQLRTAMEPPADLEDQFITHAKEWAADNGVTGDDFVAEGVDASVLRKAGMTVSQNAKKAKPVRTQRVTGQAVRAWALKQPGQFSAFDAAEAVGCHLTTAREALRKMEDEGLVAFDGLSSTWSGGGRPPRAYIVVRQEP